MKHGSWNTARAWGVRVKIGLYGGAFNPIHVNHLKVMAHALAVGNLDRIWVLPAWQHAFGKDMTPFNTRVDWVTMAVGQVFGWGNRVQVMTCERHYQTTYTVDLVENLLRDYPEDKFSLILGQDNLDVASKWHRWDDLTKMIEILAVPDQGPVRATVIRQALAEGRYEDVAGMVPSTVLRDIKDTGTFFAPPKEKA